MKRFNALDWEVIWSIASKILFVVLLIIAGVGFDKLWESGPVWVFWLATAGLVLSIALAIYGFFVLGSGGAHAYASIPAAFYIWTIAGVFFCLWILMAVGKFIVVL